MTTTTVAGTQVTTNTYDAAGRLTSVTKPDGSVETHTYDSTTTDLLSIVAVKSGTTVASSTYTYDNLGRKLTDTGIGYATSYAYDSAGQLTTENRTGSNASTSSYTYDNAGNRLTKVLNSVTESYTYDDANKLLTAGGKTYSYDNAGNVTGVSWSGGSQALTWDGESRLKSVTPSGGSATNYTYNGIGQRVAKSGAVSVTYLLGDDSIDAEVISDGNATYAHGVAGLVSENRGGTTKLYHSDALGSVRALTNTSGTVTDSASRDAFGMVVTSSGSTPTPFGFAGGHGYQQDSETGLMRLGHRMYDSATGRFISRDPIEDGYNWYTYCDNDPINALDPSGLQAWDDKSALWGGFVRPGYGGGSPGGGGGMSFISNPPRIPGGSFNAGRPGFLVRPISRPGSFGPSINPGKPNIVRLPNGTMPNKIYRGGNKITLGGADRPYIDKLTGTIKPTRGPSFNTNPRDPNIIKFGGPHELHSYPDSLTLVNTSGTHWELVPAKPGMTMPEWHYNLSLVSLFGHK